MLWFMIIVVIMCMLLYAHNLFSLTHSYTVSFCLWHVLKLICMREWSVLMYTYSCHNMCIVIWVLNVCCGRVLQHRLYIHWVSMMVIEIRSDTLQVDRLWLYVFTLFQSFHCNAFCYLKSQTWIYIVEMSRQHLCIFMSFILWLLSFSDRKSLGHYALIHDNCGDYVYVVVCT